MFKKILSIIIIIICSQLLIAQTVTVSGVSRTGKFASCSNSNPVVTAVMETSTGSSVQNGNLVITDPCGYTTLRVTVSNIRWNQGLDQNWMHGLFFPANSGVTISGVVMPTGWRDFPSCTGASCSARETGGQGFYFDGTSGNICCSGAVANDGIPNNNYGDENMDCGTPISVQFEMTFCNSEIETSTLNFTLKGTSDGNTGCWNVRDNNDNTINFSLNTVASNVILFQPQPDNSQVISECVSLLPNYQVELTGGCGNGNVITWWTQPVGGTMIGSGSPFLYDAPGNSCPEGTIVYAQCCPQGTICDSRVPVVIGPCSPINEAPTFDPIPPQCEGQPNPLPVTSIEGYTGTWSPAYDPYQTTTYTFTPTLGQCATQTTQVEVEIGSSFQATFDDIPNQCEGGNDPLPPTSIEGYTGTWAPAFDPYNTTTYIFTPTPGQCAADSDPITVVIEQKITPTFSEIPPQCPGGSNPLLTTSLEGFDGAWSPAFDPNNTQTYTFTPDVEHCAESTTQTVTINETVELAQNINIEICDNDFDGIYTYNLPDLNEALINTNMTLTWEYYLSMQDYTNQNPISQSQWLDYPVIINSSIIVVASTMQNCKSIPVEVYFIQGQAIPLLAAPYEIPFCEGESVNLTLTENTLYTSETGVDFTYYNSRENAETQTGAISDIINYTPAEIGYSLFVRIDKEDGSKCSEIVEVIFVQGQSVSLISGPYEIAFCEGESVDLTLTQDTLYTLETGVDFTYYNTRENAETQTGAISDITNYTPAEIGSSIFVRIDKEDSSKCSEIVEVVFIAGQEVLHNPGPFAPMTYCKEELINITDYISGIANESDVFLTYYLTEQDAVNGTNPIPDETAFEANGNGTIFIKLEKQDRCKVIVPLQYELLPAPELLEELPYELEICEGKETIEFSVSSDDASAVFEWTWGNNQTYAGSTISITETGIYTLTIIGSNGCRNVKEMNVRTGGEPLITSIESGSDFIIVSAQPGNGGTLEYSLNGVLWQTSPRFDNLVKGEIYTIYVRENGCLIKTYKTTILDVPNFLSPNGDGVNDLWTIRGIEITPKATIKIFNRYGKMFVDTNFDGNYVWDGKYGGRAVASGDYWYIMEIPSDGVSVAQKFVGFVSVRN